ncbi:MAG: phosphatase PAP2 family protein [Bryobacteraceae bacterium]
MNFTSPILTLSVLDQFLMRRVHRWKPPRWIRWWMIVATRGGDGWLWALFGAIVLSSREPSRYVAFAAAALAVLAGILLFRVLKKCVGRKRPCQIEPHCWCELLPPDQFSFPSGHTITAFAVAVPLGLFYPALLMGLLFCAASVAISRVLLGMHFLTDVLAGCTLGVGLGYASFWLMS